jgi:hypothetical protein
LPSGREVSLSRFAITLTYAGALEGSPEMVSPHILEHLPVRAARMLSPARPLVIVPPARMPLPKWLCVAELDSCSGARHTDPDYNSRLYVCWFADDTTRSIDAMVEAVLPQLNWEQAAEDYDIIMD